MPTPAELSHLIRKEAFNLGLGACGFSEVRQLVGEKERLESWLEAGYQGGMDYLERNQEKRLDPGILVPGAKSIISVLLNYYPPKELFESAPPCISVYARGKDYHKVLKDKLHLLLASIREKVPVRTARVFTDSAPVLERAWARNAGLGWIGKHGLLINQKGGSFYFIGEIISDLELEYDSPTGEYCGKCTRCIEACPTQAIVEPYILDARKCISYLTIESKDPIPESFGEKLQSYFFGCDICQKVCPWNSKAIPTRITEFDAFPQFSAGGFSFWRNMTEEQFNIEFKESPLKRAGWAKIRSSIELIHRINQNPSD